MQCIILSGFIYVCMALSIDPIIAVEVMAANSPSIYQPLILQCIATVVRGITSTVDIIWTTGDTQVRRVNNVTASSHINSTSVYNDSFIIPSLDINDIGSLCQCKIMINSMLPTTAKANFTILIPGTVCMHIHTYVCTCISL